MKRISILAALVALAAVGAVVAPAPAESAPAVAQTVPTITPEAVRGLMAMGGKLTVLDVRQPEEFSAGHIDGAILMPLGNLSATYASLPKSGKLIVYCRSGHRSAQAVTFLRAHGYSNAVSMAGGFTAWSASH